MKCRVRNGVTFYSPQVVEDYAYGDENGSIVEMGDMYEVQEEDTSTTLFTASSVLEAEEWIIKNKDRLNDIFWEKYKERKNL